VARVDGERGEHREHLVLEELDEEGPVVVIERGPVGEPDPAVGEPGGDLAQEDPVDVCAELDHAGADGVELLGRLEPVGGDPPQACGQLVLQARHPHLEELVEVRREDGEELGSLQERDARGVGEGEDPGVEVEPRELAVEQPELVGRAVAGGRRAGGHPR
jgi:hypothetical protein